MAHAGQFSLFPKTTLRDVAEARRAAGAGPDGFEAFVETFPEATRRADQARYVDVDVKSALTESRGMPFRWALNPYRGCTHACEYCYARKYQRHLEMGAGDEFSSVILVKRNLPAVLRREVRRPTWARESVAIGTATDPYQPIEGQARLTRQSIAVLIDAGTPLSITTKGPMVVRDADLLVEATRGAGAKVFVSMPTADETAWRQLEPGTAPPAQRLRAVRTLVDRGIDARIFMMPLVPGITTGRAVLNKTLRAIADAGVPFAGGGVVHLERDVREHFMTFLARAYPDLVEGYERLYIGAYAPRSYAAKVSETLRGLARAVGLSK
jgi:DNA repair photolyase